MYDKSTICAIIVTYNIGKDLYKCFNSIVNQVDKVVIVDNGSSKETLDVLGRLEKNKSTQVIYNNENLGIAAALNEGVKYAIRNNFKWVLTLDHDSIASPNMVKKMLNAYLNLSNEEKNKTAIVAANNIEIALTHINETKYKCKKGSEVKEITSVITSGNLVKTVIYDKIGLYDEGFFIDYVDHEFCLRLKKINYKIFLIENAILYHQLGKMSKINLLIRQIKCTNHSSIRRYYITRNRIYVWRRYFKIAPIWIINDIISFIKQFMKIILFEQEKFSKVKMIFKGIYDNMLNIYGEFKMSEEVLK